MIPVVALHGFTGSPRSWASVLSDRELALAPALGGHAGRADRVASFAAEVARLAALVRAIGRGPAHLVGYSLGGRLALGLLLEHPELFASATLVGAHPGLSHPSERAARRLADERWCELLERRGIEAFVEEWERQPLFATQARLPRAMLDEQRRQRLAHAPAGLAASLRSTGLGCMPAFVPRLGEVRAPVHLMVGELDQKFRALAEEMARALPEASIEVVPEAGHNLLIERPGAVARAISRGIDA